MKTTSLLNKVFNRDDLQRFTTMKDKKENIFDDIIGEYKDIITGDVHKIHYTNDPIKMLGCGYRIQSSYSPQSESFKYLPSFVLQDYIGMLYITDGALYYIDRDGERLQAPNYLVRAFVMIDPRTKEILFKMPVYTDNNRLYGAFESVPSVEYGVIVSDTVAPEIHLDVLNLYMKSKQDERVDYPKRHVAMCGRPYPCREAMDTWIQRLNYKNLFAKNKKDK